MSNLIELSVFQGSTLIARQSFDQDKIILGRISSADFRIPSPQVSRIHALLEILPDGQLKITDLASTHGTFVNGAKIVEAILRETDQIKVADVAVKLVRVARPVETTQRRSPTLAPTGASSSPVAPSVVPEEKPAPAVATSHEAPATPAKPREATVIRSLKQTATSRGVLEAKGTPAEELEVTVYWEDTILAIDHYPANGTITLGDGVNSTYLVTDSAIPQKYKFVHVRGNRVELNIHPAMKLSARINGHMYTHEDLVKSGKTKIELSGSDIAKVRVGNIHFFLMFVPDPPTLARGPIIERDPVFWGFFATVFIVSFLVLTYLMVFQQPIEGEVREFPEKFRKILVTTYKMKVEHEKLPVQEITKIADKPKTGTGKEEAPKVHNPDAVIAERNQKGGNEGEGKRNPGPEGKRGEKNSPHDTGITVAPKVKGNDTHQPGPSNANAKGNAKVPSKYGLLNSLKSAGLTYKLGKIAGTNGGNDDLEENFRGYGGAARQSARGTPNGALRGTGNGGGGTDQPVGIGGTGTKGFGEGGKGNGLGGIPGNAGNALITTESGGISVGAGLSKEEIDRVVKQHKNELEYCVQQAKQKNPGTAGKIALGWSILTGGVVGKARSVDNTTNDDSLVECFIRRLQQWKFPSPPGNTAEVEYYPFTIK